MPEYTSPSGKYFDHATLRFDGELIDEPKDIETFEFDWSCYLAHCTLCETWRLNKVIIGLGAEICPGCGEPYNPYHTYHRGFLDK